ncbi:MAG TPA: CinA family nicotinamide mononucleotide deamidase-related protein [Gemmatimonadales bacterium]
MDLEVVTIGSELTLGLTVDTNAADLCRSLSAIGGRVRRVITVEDAADAIQTVVGEGLARTGVVVVTGGLGPTHDDITKRAVADLLGRPIVPDATLRQQLEAWWARLGRAGEMPAANLSQAELPAGATPLANPRGTAPGLWIEDPRGLVILLPGVPHEMHGLLEEEVLPRLRTRAGDPLVTASCTLRTTGISESALADLLRDIAEHLAPTTFASLPTGSGVDLRLTVWGVPAHAAAERLAAAVASLRPVLGIHCYGEGDEDLAAVVVERLRATSRRLAVAESCTGGLVGGRITAVPGASAVFAGGVIAYADHVKPRELGVAEAVLTAEGAVSEAVVRAMARGVASRFEVPCGLAVSGIAGPAGGTPEKPVGTVWLCAVVESEEHTVRLQLPGGRSWVRQRATQAALDLLRRALAPG